MVGEVVSAFMEIVNWPPLITAPSKKFIGVLLVLAAAVTLVELLAVLICVSDVLLKILDIFFCWFRFKPL